MVTPRTKPPEQRRGDLLDAAEAVLMTDGITALTVDELVARAGVAKGTYYLYFRSKEHVLVELRRRFVDQLIRRQTDEVGALPADDWLARLQLWVELGIRDYTANSKLHDALFQHSTAEEHEYRGLSEGNPHVDALRELLAAGVEAGSFSVVSVSTAAVLLYAMMHGSSDYLIDHPGKLDVEQLIEEAHRLCRSFMR